MPRSATHSSYQPYMQGSIVLCPYCRSPFNRAASLRFHLKGHEQVEEKILYKCTWPGCTHQTFHRGNLTSHMCIHTGEKPHECPYEGCTFRTAHRPCLSRHKKKLHGYKVNGGSTQVEPVAFTFEDGSSISDSDSTDEAHAVQGARHEPGHGYSMVAEPRCMDAFKDKSAQAVFFESSLGTDGSAAYMHAQTASSRKHIDRRSGPEIQPLVRPQLGAHNSQYAPDAYSFNTQKLYVRETSMPMYPSTNTHMVHSQPVYYASHVPAPYSSASSPSASSACFSSSSSSSYANPEPPHQTVRHQNVSLKIIDPSCSGVSEVMPANVAYPTDYAVQSSSDYGFPYSAGRSVHNELGYVYTTDGYYNQAYQNSNFSPFISYPIAGQSTYPANTYFIDQNRQFATGESLDRDFSAPFYVPA